MKGSPLIETLIALSVLLGLLIPLSSTSTVFQPDPSSDSLHEHKPESIICWVSVRFSHPVASARIEVAEQTFETGSDSLGINLETELSADGVSLVLDVEWPELKGTPYAQITVEPDGLETQTLGMWGKPGVQTRRWFINPVLSE